MRLFLAFQFLLVAGCKSAPEIIENGTVIENVTIIGGEGEATLENARVLIEDGRIVSITSSVGDPPPVANVLDGDGKFLLPGFIDMHAHLLFPRCSGGEGIWFDEELSKRALVDQLANGITTIRSPANPTVLGLKLRDALNQGALAGPSAFASAEFINNSSLNDGALRRLVVNAAAANADYVKAYASLSSHQISLLADEAEKQGLELILHAQRTSWAEAVDLGVDHLVHAVDWSPMSLPPDKRADYRAAVQGKRGFLARLEWLDRFDPDSAHLQPMLDALVKQGISVDLTLIALDAKFSSPNDNRYRTTPGLANYPSLRDEWMGCANATKNWTRSDHQRWQELRPRLFRWVERLHEAGVLLVTGTDLTNPWIAPGEGLHQEFELLAEAGLTPGEILQMTGRNAARALGVDDIGQIKAGSRADLILLNENPLQDIGNTRSIAWVMKDGKLVSETDD